MELLNNTKLNEQELLLISKVFGEKSNKPRSLDDLDLEVVSGGGLSDTDFAFVVLLGTVITGGVAGGASGAILGAQTGSCVGAILGAIAGTAAGNIISGVTGWFVLDKIICSRAFQKFFKT